VEAYSKDRYCPEKILQLAESNPLVAECLLLWRKGELAWDEALAYALVRLAEHGDRLETLVARLLEKKEDAVRLGAGDSGVVRLGEEANGVIPLGPDDLPPAGGPETTKGAKTTKGGAAPKAGQPAKGGEK
jgi:hypothetical protein